MSLFQIAQGTGHGFSITLYIEAESDPQIDIDLHLKEVDRIAGNNNFDVPIGHLQNEWQVEVIDKNNVLFNTLNNYDQNARIEIIENGNLRLRGHVNIGSRNFYFAKQTNNVTLICDDGLIALQGQATVSTLNCRTFKQIGIVFYDLVQSVFPAAALKIKMGLAYNGASAHSGAVSMQHRINVESLVRDMERPNDYQFLKRLCEDFELCIFQENGDYYVLDNYSRAQPISELYDVGAGAMVPVDLSQEMTANQLRADPYSFSPKPFGLIQTTSKVLSANQEIVNADFEMWSSNELFPTDDPYPLDWCFDDAAAFERSGFNSIFRPLQEGRLLYQWILTGTTRFTEVDLDFDLSASFVSNEIKNGTAVIKMARLRILTKDGFKGYNTTTDRFEIGNDGYLTVERDYPSSSSTTKFVSLPDKTFIAESSNVLLELFYIPNDIAKDVVRKSTYSGTPIVEYDRAIIKLQSPAETMQFTAESGQFEPVLIRQSYISDARASYILGDLEYYDDTTSEWKVAGNNWGNGNFRIYELTSRRIGLWGHKLRIFELPTLSGQYFHMYNQFKLHYQGEIINCIPVRIKSRAKSGSQDTIRLIECEVHPSAAEIELTPNYEARTWLK